MDKPTWVKLGGEYRLEFNVRRKNTLITITDEGFGRWGVKATVTHTEYAEVYLRYTLYSIPTAEQAKKQALLFITASLKNIIPTIESAVRATSQLAKTQPSYSELCLRKVTGKVKHDN